MATFTEWFDTGLRQTQNVLDIRKKILDMDNDEPVTPSVMPTEKATNYLPFIAVGAFALILLMRKK